MPRIVALLTLALAALAMPAQVSADDRPDPAQVEFFESRIRPLLVARCIGCHGPDKQKGELRLDSRDALMEGGESGPAVSPGSPSTSLLITAIGYDGDIAMPPKGKLDPEDIAALTEWVRQGAVWPDSPKVPKPVDGAPAPDPSSHWSFQPVRPVSLPAVHDASWPKGRIDHFILQKIEGQGLRPVDEADRRTLIRRATFDLTGLPPTPQEVDAFLGDSSPDAFAKVVDRLLGSPQYGERWGRHWLDVARYGEDQAHTFEARLYPHGYKYRDWVVKALNDDMPFDRFVAEQIAGDLMDEGPEADRQARRAAVGYFALGPVYYGGAVADERDDRIDTLSRGFLALTVSCARCHDHKYDPIPTEDYYALAGIFASTNYQEYPAASKDVVAAYEAGQARVKAKNDEIDAFIGLSYQRNYFALPKAKKPDESWLLPGEKARVKVLKAEAELLKKTAPPRYPVIHSLADADAAKNLKVAIRGNPENLGDEVPRRFLKILSSGTPEPFAKGSGRLELARAIASRDNPLTPRVIVNRIWEHHFGRGIVATPSNFGILGERPTHPELLDDLAGRFVANGWSLKALHREIMLSATYQLSSRIDPKNQEVDADNTLLWRMNRRRLEVESWRDAMLAVSGNLDATVGGPSNDLAKAENHRRTLYGAVSRHNLDPLLRLFDFPDPNLTCDRRAITSVPLQQLFVLNSEFMVRQAQALAKRLTAQDDDDAERIRRAYPLLFGRPAESEEVELGTAFLASAKSAGDQKLTAWEQYAQALLGSNEFAFVD